MKNHTLAQDARRKETGFVGFFDILGYKSFLESGISEVAFKVVEILAQLPNKVEESVSKHIGNGPVTDVQWALKRVMPLVVSDSILLRLSYDENHDHDKKSVQAAAFIVTASILQRMMFEEGLPLRGAIAFGDFIFANHVFAGKPIVDAYYLGHSLNLAACAIHETAGNEFKRLVSNSHKCKGFLSDGLHLVQYPVPLKKAEMDLQLLCLNLAWPTLKGYKPLKERKNLQQYVLEQFSAHNKQVGMNEIPKVENTENFLRFLEKRFPYLFDRDP